MSGDRLGDNIIQYKSDITLQDDLLQGWASIILKNNNLVQLKIYHEGSGLSTAYSITVNIRFIVSEERESFGSFEDFLANAGDYVVDPSLEGTEKLEKKVGVILSTITNIGIILSVIMLTVLGVKYMLGSVEEKADYKKDLIPYLIGACLLFGICTFVKILQGIGVNINSKHMHRWDEGTVIVPVSCLVDGEKEYKCLDCGYALKVITPGKVHDPEEDFTILETSTCMNEGKMGKKCKNCSITLVEDKIEKNPDNHIPRIVEEKLATCTEVGHTSGRICNNPTCGTNAAEVYEISGTPYAIIEGIQETPKVAHNEVANPNKPRVEPTCGATGLTQGTWCSECHTSIGAQVEIAATGLHNEVANPNKLRKEPTCTKTGLTAGTWCSDCHTIIDQQETIAALGHVEVIDAAVAATCAVKGKTQGKHCSRCNTVLVAQSETAKLTTHTWGGWTTTTTATCTTNGSKQRSCTICSKTETGTIAATAHNYVTYTAKTPTCNETGNTAGKKCSNCGNAKDGYQVLNKDPHNHTNRTKRYVNANKNGFYYHNIYYDYPCCNKASELKQSEARCFNENGDRTCDGCGYTRPFGGIFIGDPDTY